MLQYRATVTLSCITRHSPSLNSTVTPHPHRMSQREKWLFPPLFASGAASAFCVSTLLGNSCFHFLHCVPRRNVTPNAFCVHEGNKMGSLFGARRWLVVYLWKAGGGQHWSGDGFGRGWSGGRLRHGEHTGHDGGLGHSLQRSLRQWLRHHLSCKISLFLVRFETVFASTNGRKLAHDFKFQTQFSLGWLASKKCWMPDGNFGFLMLPFLSNHRFGFHRERTCYARTQAES